MVNITFAQKQHSRVVWIIQNSIAKWTDSLRFILHALIHPFIQANLSTHKSFLSNIDTLSYSVGWFVADNLFFRTTPLCCSLCASERKWCRSIFNYTGNYSCLLSNTSETLALQSVSPPACSYCWVFPQWLSTLLSLCDSHTCWLEKTASLWWTTPNAGTTYSSPCPLQRHSG